MNFTQAFESALKEGIDPPKSTSVTEERVKGIHNDWLRHQDTIDLVKHLIALRQKFTDVAVYLAANSEAEELKIRANLCKAKGIDLILEHIKNYGE